MDKTGIVITTFLRDELLEKSTQSIVESHVEDCKIIIIDQNPSDFKRDNYYLNGCYYIPAPYNSGLSYGRNIGVQKAKELGCDYVLISSDSFLMNESIKKLNYLIENNLFDYDIIGFYLSGCVCGWEAKLNLIEGQSFELDFIDKTKIPDYVDLKEGFGIYNCDIVKNFFIAKTDSLLKSPWDNNLLLGEHEDFFWQAKQNYLKVGWMDYITAEKMKDRPDEYADFRRKNFNDGIYKLKEKYKIKGWVTYKNLNRSKEN